MIPSPAQAPSLPAPGMIESLGVLPVQCAGPTEGKTETWRAQGLVQVGVWKQSSVP